jgi:uncharacterized protein YyaL (SSP411 family)
MPVKLFKDTTVMNKPNRLINEISPYLLQHAKNPVAWFPWDDEAFETAKSQDKPIFLSIGYSTCHWCHVMAHECFEDEDVARAMNDAFISIKVDREELPHIDAIYMNVCHMLTGRGGWPLTIIMTPDKMPFFAATYLPKHSRGGLTGLTELIPLIKNAWRTRKKELLESAGNISERVAEALTHQGGTELDKQLLHDTFSDLRKKFSSPYGGFSDAPKFPTPHNILFLLRYFVRTRDNRALAMAVKTLDSMSMGGIHDLIGFGFHRYSTDERWLVPHFEKMLYDQALLSIAYTEAFLVTAKSHYRRTAQDIIEYVLRDMISDEGLFFSAEDADSEGVEGKFYLWKDRELKSILNREDYLLAAEVFSIQESGNFPQNRGKGENILHLKESPADIARRLGIEEEALLERLARIRSILFEKRSQRVRPLRDEKVLTDWNGLMIAALARAAQAFTNPGYARIAGKAAAFILDNMVSPEGRLYHIYSRNTPRRDATADDYAFLVWGLIELYEATFDPSYLHSATRLAGTCIEHYMDKKNGGFFYTADDADVVIARTKQLFDGALPSSNSVLMLDLLRLARITGDIHLEQTAQQTGRAFSQEIARAPGAHTFMMAGMDFLYGPSQEVVISGDMDRSDTREMVRALQSRFLPHTVVILRPDQTCEGMLHHIKDMVSLDGQATAYVCTDRSCKAPTTDVEEMISLLEVKRREPHQGK